MVLVCLNCPLFSASTALAQPVCSSPSGHEGPISTIKLEKDSLAVEAFGQHECRRGVHVDLIATRDGQGDTAPRGSASHSLSPTGIFTIPIFCRRDDYMFLPPDAQAGLPCASVPSDEHFDPRPLALRMAAELPPPDLRIGMNPAKGMVNLPTWFWVEGYDGGTLSESETVLEQHEECHFVVEHDADGLAILDDDGHPLSRRDCTVKSTTFVVDVRLWPNHFAWDFGDNHGRTIDCPGKECGDALGLPYVDTAHPSPIRHPYHWSSLGQNGLEDAYTIKLGITFAADFRVTVGGSTGGWQSLPERLLTWTRSHQVQEAQAVLTRP